MVGRLSAADFECMVRVNMLKNCPISVTDIKNSYTIFGPDIGSLRGKTVKKIETVISDYVAIPEQIKDKMKRIELSVDVMFVNKIPFMISFGNNMKFTTIENVVDQKADTLFKALRSIKSVSTNKNIFIKTLFVDNKFEVVRDNLQEELLNPNTTKADEHIPQIER